METSNKTYIEARNTYAILLNKLAQLVSEGYPETDIGVVALQRKIEKARATLKETQK